MNMQINQTEVKLKLKDIYLSVVWGKIAREYFGKSSSWLYNKMNGRDGNGGEGKFTDTELNKLKQSLLDFSDRIRKCAETL